MYKQLKEQFEYKFNIENAGLYSILIKASCKNGKFFGLFGGEDLRVEVDDIKLREIPAENKHTPCPSQEGKCGAVIDEEPKIAEIKNPNDIKLNLQEQAQDGNRRPWITLALIDLPLRILDAGVSCEKRKGDSDDKKLIIDGKVENHESGNWWGKNWLWQGRELKGDTRLVP